MSITGWVMMILVLGGVWGGLVYLLLRTVQQPKE